MVFLSMTRLIIVDVCVVTTTKDMDNTCMLASILHDSPKCFIIYLTIDNFEKVVCVAAAKVPVVKIWDAELYVHLRIV
jgi:DNA polymerase sigma